MEWAALRHLRDRGIDFTELVPEGTPPSGAVGGDRGPNGGPGVEVRFTSDVERLPEGWEVPSFVLDPLPVFEEILGRIDGRRTAPSGLGCGAGPGHEAGLVEELSCRFHVAVVEGILSAVLAAAEATGLRKVCLGGGVFQNMLLRSLLLPALRGRGFEVFLNRRVSPGDGGLALGQAYIRRKRGAKNFC